MLLRITSLGADSLSFTVELALPMLHPRRRDAICSLRRSVIETTWAVTGTDRWGLSGSIIYRAMLATTDSEGVS